LDRADDIALFRYGIVREVSDPRLSKAERGRLVRTLAAEVHTGPKGEEVGAPSSEPQTSAAAA
jgi:putative transposase